MGLMDTISNLAGKFAPSSHSKPLSGGIGSGHGMVHADDDMIVSKPTIVFHTTQIFFNFLAMATMASVASFQAHWKIGPSGLSGFAIFVSILGMLLSAFMLLIPVAYEKYDKFVRLARALKEIRVGFILTGAGVTFSLLIAFIVTISAWTEPGCKNADNDPHAEPLGDEFKKGLPGWCNTKKAAAIFFWLAFVFWIASVVLLFLDWRSGKLHHHTAHDQPFQRPAPTHDEEEAGDDEDEGFTHIPPIRHNSASAGGTIASRYDDQESAQSPFADPQPRYGHTPAGRPNMDAYGAFSDHPPSAYTPAVQAGRPSMDAYGAFSDPAPSGFGTAGAGGGGYRRSNTDPPFLPEPDLGGPMVSRTMQYADPYVAARVAISGGQASPTGVPPSYENYQGYQPR